MSVSSISLRLKFAVAIKFLVYSESIIEVEVKLTFWNTRIGYQNARIFADSHQFLFFRLEGIVVGYTYLFL